MQFEFELIVRLLLASACGGIIGLERMLRLKEAGIRTHVIVCCASALMMIVSKYGFADVAPGVFGTDAADPARIAAQVITGVSFLGAGVIFHHANAVKGLTTAAGLWATAGIGLALGSGMYLMGISATTIIMVVQAVLYRLSILKEKHYAVKLSMTVKNDAQIRRRLFESVHKLGADIDESSVKITNDGMAVYSMTLRIAKNISVNDIGEMFDSDDDIKEISFRSVR